MRKLFIAEDGRLRWGWALLVFIAALVVASTALGAALKVLGGNGLRMDNVTALGSPALIPLCVARLLAALAATWAGCAAVRQRLRDANLVDARWPTRLAAGFGLGALAISMTVGLAWALGFEHLAGPVNSARRLVGAGLVQLAIFAPASTAEELILRGFAFQQLARGFSGLARAALPRLKSDPAHPGAARFGTWMAVLITGVVFGLAHGSNPNISRAAVVNIILVGLWLGTLVARTGSLWLTIGLHIGWNWCQGFLWGEPVSGLATGTSVMQRWASGDALWTGGAFGPEASLFASFVLGAMWVVTLAWRPRARETPAASA